ncbi:zinc finger, CCCH type domain-containing protein [Cryptosporidium serpentis]
MCYSTVFLPQRNGFIRLESCAKIRKNANKKKKKKRLKENLKDNPANFIRARSFCTFFLKGRCDRGSTCQFLHTAEPITKQKPCWYFLGGSCAKGAECLYSHDLSQFPCRYIHTIGFCRNLQNCRFSHRLPLSDSQKEEFVRNNKDYLLLSHKDGGPKDIDPSKRWWEPYLQKIVKEDDKESSDKIMMNKLYKECREAIPDSISTCLLTKQNEPILKTHLESSSIISRDKTFILSHSPPSYHSTNPLLYTSDSLEYKDSLFKSLVCPSVAAISNHRKNDILPSYSPKHIIWQ